MKKLSILSILSLSALLLTACGGDDAKEKTSEAKKEVKDTTMQVKTASESVVKKTEKEKTPASSPAVNLTVCFSCHGGDFGLKALGASKVVKDMTKADIIASLKGYKDGSYGGNMKAIMLPQVAALSGADIKAIAAIIVGD